MCHVMVSFGQRSRSQWLDEFSLKNFLVLNIRLFHKGLHKEDKKKKKSIHVIGKFVCLCKFHDHFFVFRIYFFL